MKIIPCVPAQLKGSLLIFFVMSSYPNCNSPSVFLEKKPDGYLKQ